MKIHFFKLIPQSGLIDTRKLVSYLRDIYPSDHDKEIELHLLTKAIYKCKTHGAVSGDKWVRKTGGSNTFFLILKSIF